MVDGELVDFNEFFFQRFERLVIEFELDFQSPIRRTSPLLEEVDNLVEYFVEVHYRTSDSSSTNALASLTSAVSKPDVNQL
jgi:hypothetical protein